MSVTSDTSHSPIGPIGESAQSPTGDALMHASMAALSSALDRGLNTAVEGTGVKHVWVMGVERLPDYIYMVGSSRVFNVQLWGDEGLW